jgi:hypothetical protein
MSPEERARWSAAARRLGVSLEEYAAHRAAGERWCWRCRSWLPEASFPQPQARHGSPCLTCRATADVGARRARLAGQATPAPAADSGERAAAARLGVSAEDYLAHREAGERWCSGCRAWLPEANFHAQRGGSTSRQGQCRECQKRRFRERYAALPAEKKERIRARNRQAREKGEAE